MTNHDLANAKRTLLKCEEVLQKCQQYFAYQAQMNATAHLSSTTMYSPLHSAISSTLRGISMYDETYGLEVDE